MFGNAAGIPVVADAAGGNLTRSWLGLLVTSRSHRLCNPAPHPAPPFKPSKDGLLKPTAGGSELPGASEKPVHNHFISTLKKGQGVQLNTALTRGEFEGALLAA